MDNIWETICKETACDNSYEKGYLMLSDTPVIYFNFPDGVISILEENLIPYGLRGKFDNSTGMFDIRQSIDYLYKFRDWLSRRVISISIGNYKQLSTYFQIAQNDGLIYKSDIALKCRAISIEDAYWVKYENEDKKWEEVSPYKNHFEDIVNIALSESIPGVTGDLSNPNISIHGTFRKALKRDNNGGSGLILMKMGKTPDDVNAKVEWLTSRLAKFVSTLEFSQVEYLSHEIEVDDRDRFITVCDSYYVEGYSVVSAFDMYQYLGKEGFRDWIHSSELLLTNFANMIVWDYLMANTDRHLDNYAYYMSNATGEIIDVVPLYDMNYSFISDICGKSINDCLCQALNDGRSIKKVVYEYAKYSNILIKDREGFLSKINSEMPEILSNGFLLERISYLESLGCNIFG